MRENGCITDLQLSCPSLTLQRYWKEPEHQRAVLHCPASPSKELKSSSAFKSFSLCVWRQKETKSWKRKVEGYQRRDLKLIQKGKKKTKNSALEDTYVAVLILFCTTLAGSGRATSSRKTPSHVVLLQLQHCLLPSVVHHSSLLGSSLSHS